MSNRDTHWTAFLNHGGKNWPFLRLPVQTGDLKNTHTARRGESKHRQDVNHGPSALGEEEGRKEIIGEGGGLSYGGD